MTRLTQSHFQRRGHLAWVALVSVLLTSQAAIGAEMQTFDSAASAASAGWTEFGSRINNFDFGYSNSNNAEGGSGPGEAGGIIARSEPTAYYGDIFNASFDLNRDMHATGRMKFQDDNFDGAWYLGWFSSVEAEEDDRDYLGISVAEPRSGLWRARASIDGDDGDQMDLPDDTALNFVINWDADGGTHSGEGRLTVNISTLDGSETWSSISDGFDGSQVDAFGLLSNSQSGDPDQIGGFFFDDVTYTTPEPGTMMLALLLLGPAALGSRRRGR